MAYSLCCISNVLKKQGVSFKTKTFKQFKKELAESQPVAINNLIDIYCHNLEVTAKHIEYCSKNGWNYRMSSSLFPLLTHPESDINKNIFENIKIKYSIDKILDAIAQSSSPVRLSCHPDQFCVLASENEPAVKKSIEELEIYGQLLSILCGDTGYLNPINIHLNNNQDLTLTIRRFAENFKKCSENIRSRLVLENEDKGIWSPQNLVEKTRFLKIPITFDNLHYKCNAGTLFTEEDAFLSCYDTWPCKPLFHYSESDNNDRTHATLPKDKPRDYQRSVDWDVELKGKDDAILALEGKDPIWDAL